MPDNIFDLTGKTALVTGAASGLGRELAKALAGAGAMVALADLRAAVETAEEIGKAGGKALPLVADVTEEQSVAGLFESARGALGNINILVNCAGITQEGNTPTEQSTLEVWDRVMAVNLRGVFLCCREGGGMMIKSGGGSIINIASTAGRRGIPRVAAYCASKAGVEMLTKTLALEWARHNVRVNAIAPHYLETPMTAGVYADPKVKEALDRQIPMRRFGKPSEIAGALLLLASGAGSYMTGTIVEVDGGFLA